MGNQSICHFDKNKLCVRQLSEDFYTRSLGEINRNASTNYEDSPHVVVFFVNVVAAVAVFVVVFIKSISFLAMK